MSMVVKVVLGVLIAGLLLFGGCAVLFGAFVGEADKGVTRKGVITRADAAQVKKGMTKRQVTRILGRPRITQETEDELGGEEYLYYNSEAYLYYNVKREGALPRWQFVFRKGKLVSKNQD